MASSGAEEFGVGVREAAPSAPSEFGAGESSLPLEDARTADAHAAESCPECGAALLGDYCHQCGEKHLSARDLSVRHFFDEAAQELTSVEHSKLFHTIFALLFRPGFLTNEWVAGRRKRYLKPLNLCLGLFALSLFAYSVYKPVSTFDVEKIIKENSRGDSAAVFDRFAAKKHIEKHELFERLSEKWQRYMSFSPLLIIGGFALVLQLAFILSRRYFVEHLVFSMHFISFTMLTMILMWPVYFFIGIKTGGLNTIVAGLRWLLDLVYMFFAVRAFYRLGTARTLLASLPLTLGYFASYVIVFGGALIAAIITLALSSS